MEHETIEIKYQTDGGHGCMTLNAENFFPCSSKHLNFLLKKVIALCYWDEQEKVITQIEDHCIRGIAETEEYKKLMPKFYQETKEHIPELEGKVTQYERMVERIQEDKKNAKGQRKKDLAAVLKKAKEELKTAKSHLRNTEAKCKEYVRKFEEASKKIERYKQNLEILKQRK